MLQQNTTRSGPHPLPIHLGLAQFYALKSNDDLILQKMIEGIQKYHNSSYRPQQSKLPVIWQQGEARILLCAAQAGKPADAPSIVLVPSLINRSSIFDLCEGRSLVRWLAEKGVNVYLLDWGAPMDDKAQHDVDGVVLKRLIPALSFVTKHAGRKCHVLGYCMGGTLLLGAASKMQNEIESVTLLATPWDFSLSMPKLLQQIEIGYIAGDTILSEKGFLPAASLQGLFAALDPEKAMRKFIDFAAMEQKSEEAHLFVAVEDWLNEGVDLPRAVAHTCLYDWFLRNKPGKGEWRLGGEVVNPQKIEVPLLVIASRKDRLVSYNSAMAVMENMPTAHHIDPPCGHIGMIAGNKAPENVWRPILGWIQGTLPV